MSQEKFELNNGPETGHSIENTEPNVFEERKVSSKRLMLAIEANLKLVTKEIKVYGEDHIKNIPQGKKVIIATTHISDLDLPIVATVLGKYFDIAITNQSLHHSFLAEPSINMAMKVAGKENFIPIDYNKVDGEKKGFFNPDNFEIMSEALKNGKAIIIAAHNPAKNWKLPKGGYGVAYLSDITDDVIILPVTVNLESSEPIGMADNMVKNIIEKPVASVYINEPIELEKIPGLEELSQITDKRKEGKILNHDERNRFSELKKLLENQSDSIMNALSANLPNPKKGKYGSE